MGLIHHTIVVIFMLSVICLEARSADDSNCRLSCTEGYRPVCGDNGESYPNKCFMDALSCFRDEEIKIDFEGRCERCAIPCGYNYDPVCGNNGKTYDNACLLRYEQCKMKKAVTVVHEGPCSEVASCNITCEEEEKMPICGSNGKKYQNECELRKESCETRKAIGIVKLLLKGGTCDDCPRCTRIGDEKVCGSDGNTYDDACVLRHFSCFYKTPINRVHDGACNE